MSRLKITIYYSYQYFASLKLYSNWRRGIEEENVFNHEIAFTLSHYRHGPNETNNMLATLDDISNLNLNNLAGSALGLWDHARVFLLSFLAFPLSLAERLSVFRVSPLFLVSSISLLYVVRAAIFDSDTCVRGWISTYKVVSPCSLERREWERTDRGILGYWPCVNS